MISERCAKYLATLERVPQIYSRPQIEAALEAAGAPILEPIVDFQLQFGGYVQKYGLNRFEWGIIHAHPSAESFFEPNQVAFDGSDGSLYFTCCNCHGSDHWFLDATGALYWCFTPALSESFTHKIERDAVSWDLAVRFPAARRITLELPRQEGAAALTERLKPGQIVEASDKYENLFIHNGVYASIKGDSYIALVLTHDAPTVLGGLDYKVLSQR